MATILQGKQNQVDDLTLHHFLCILWHGCTIPLLEKSKNNRRYAKVLCCMTSSSLCGSSEQRGNVKEFDAGFVLFLLLFCYISSSLLRLNVTVLRMCLKIIIFSPYLDPRIKGSQGWS